MKFSNNQARDARLGKSTDDWLLREVSRVLSL
jgi:hypothetical protein